MITLFLSPSCTSCRKARAWLLNHEVPFQEHNIMTSPLSAPELQHILSLTENGTDDIISTPRSYRKEELRSATMRADIQ